MTQLKKDKAPLFYQLTNEEWVETVKDLTGAEIKVLYYVRSLDPFGDRKLDYSVTQMALQLGLSKGAVSKALKKLDQMDLIDVELVQVKVCIKTNKNSIAEFPKGNSVSYRKQEFPIGNEDFPEETEVSSRKQQLLIGNEQQLESCPNKDSNLSHTNKTYSDFIQTLSDSERENFEKFVRDSWRKKTAKNGEPGEEIISMERFLNRAEDLNNWWQRFLNSAAGCAAKKRTATNSYNWRNDKRFNEWIWQTFERGYEWVNENEAEREVRQAFHNWAFAVNAFEGVCL